MKASELRIGNYVLISSNYWDYKPDRDGIIKVEEINEYGINGEFDYQMYKYSCDEIEPISITEEWLIKFRFRKTAEGVDSYYWVKGTFNLYYSDEDAIEYQGNFWFEVYGRYPTVKYVHQLQNLFFALTGEELTIKE